MNDEFVAEIQGFMGGDQIRFDVEVRLRHSHGHTQGEIFALKHAVIDRLSDVVVFPDNESKIENIAKSFRSKFTT